MVDDDVAAVATAVSDRHATAMLAHWVTLPRNAAGRRDAVRRALLGPWAHGIEPFAVLDAERKVIGVRWLEHGPLGRHPVSCGGWIAERQRRRGHGSGALRLACHYAARILHVPSIVTGTRDDNVAAQAGLAACGFTHVGDDPRPPHITTGPEHLQRWALDLEQLAALGPMAATASRP
jgi:RimJ/RimL family protein N-acetyltransferase